MPTVSNLSRAVCSAVQTGVGRGTDGCGYRWRHVRALQVGKPLVRVRRRLSHFTTCTLWLMLSGTVLTARSMDLEFSPPLTQTEAALLEPIAKQLSLDKERFPDGILITVDHSVKESLGWTWVDTAKVAGAAVGGAAVGGGICVILLFAGVPVAGWIIAGVVVVSSGQTRIFKLNWLQVELRVCDVGFDVWFEGVSTSARHGIRACPGSTCDTDSAGCHRRWGAQPGQGCRTPH